MLTHEELLVLIRDLESDRVERTTSTKDTEKFCEAICAFANDLPNHQSNRIASEQDRENIDRASDCTRKNV